MYLNPRVFSTLKEQVPPREKILLKHVCFYSYRLLKKIVENTLLNPTTSSFNKG